MPKSKSKVKKMHKCQYLAASALFLCLFSMPSFAANYDLQPYTSCSNGQCTTSLDITSLGLSTQKVNNIKAMNLTNFLTRSGVINNFAWSWNGNIITITGTVRDNVYWRVTAGSDSLDPWWNYTQANNGCINTTYCVLALPFNESTGTTAWDYSGLGFNASLGNSAIWSALGKYNSAINTPTYNANVINNAYIQLGNSFTLMFWANWSGSAQYQVPVDKRVNAAGNGIYFYTNGATNKMMAGLSGTEVSSLGTINDKLYHHYALVYNKTENRMYLYVDGTYNANASFSATYATTANLNIGGNTNNGEDFNGIIDEFKLFNSTLNVTQIGLEMNSSIINQTSVSLFWTANLYLNGTEANYTSTNSTPLWIYALTNLTGLNVSIYKNGTLINSSLTSCNYTANSTAGLWNITATYSNASVNTSLTYWANLTYTAPATPGNATFTYNFDLNTAPLTCANASYAQRNATVDSSFHQEVYPCPYGCDTNANSGCLPAPYQQNLITLAVVIGIIIAAGLLWRWMR